MSFSIFYVSYDLSRRFPETRYVPTKFLNLTAPLLLLSNGVLLGQFFGDNFVDNFMDHLRLNFRFFLPTVNVVQADDCLHMAIQSRVTEVSSWVTRPRTLHSEASHITVVPEVFS